MELWGLLAESQVLQQFTPATQNMILVEHKQGHAVKMEDGQAKNQPARVSFVNGQRGTNLSGELKVEETRENKIEVLEEGVCQ